VALGISVVTILIYIGAILDIAAGFFTLMETTTVADAAEVAESTITDTAIALIVVGVIMGLLAFMLRRGQQWLAVDQRCRDDPSARRRHLGVDRPARCEVRRGGHRCHRIGPAVVRHGSSGKVGLGRCRAERIPFSSSVACRP
jgi:hypothetical protein